MIPALPPMPNWLLPLVGIPLGIGFWCLVVAMISLFGGWHSLAKSYRREETTFRVAGADEGERFRWASLVMGPPFFPTNYGSCVTVIVGERGVGLQVMLLFRMLHPPLLIPWSAIENCELGKEFFLCWFWRAKLDLRDRRHPLRIYGPASQAIARAWSQQHGVAEERE